MKYMNNEDSEAETRSFSEGFSMEQASFRGSASKGLGSALCLFVEHLL